MLLRTLLSLTGLLASVARLHAGTISLAWDFALAWQPNTTYSLHIVTVQRGVPIATDQSLTLLDPSRCREPTPDTLCADLCLEPGDYTVSVTAFHGGDRSAPSNLLDLDLTSTTRCTPLAKPVVPALPTPVPKPTPPPVAALALTGAAAALLATQSVPPPLPALVNMGCISWHITGVCACGFPPRPCVTLEYFEPAYLIETVKNPGDSVLPVLGDLLSGALAVTGTPAIGGGGAANAAGQGQTNLHYGEAHVYTFPQLLGGPCTACLPSGGLALHYASELDPVWRTAVAVPSPLDLVTQIGTWARLYPRSGKVIHSSEPVASGVQATRALDIMRQPVGTPPNVDAHIIVAPGSAGIPACLQLAWPKQTPCFHPGFPNALWETGALALRGKYLWIAFKKRVCCVDPATSKCGIALVGGQGANTCALPSLP